MDSEWKWKAKISNDKQINESNFNYNEDSDYKTIITRISLWKLQAFWKNLWVKWNRMKALDKMCNLDFLTNYSSPCIEIQNLISEICPKS